jgi:hypothetical protein
MIPSQVDSLAVYQTRFLLSLHCRSQQVKQNARRLLSQLLSQICQLSSLRKCWQIILGPPRHSLLSTSAISATAVIIQTSTKGLNTQVQPQRHLPEIMRLSQQAHDQMAVDCRPGTAPDADLITKMNLTVPHIFSHHRRLKRSTRELQTCQTYRLTCLLKSKTRS